jgi:hypothetical protein
VIYWAQIKHNRRTYEPEFIMPETHDHRKHALFVKRPARLPEEQFSRMPSVAPWRTTELFDPEMFPAWVKFKTPEKEVQDFYKLHQWLLVSQRVKDKIEELEPSVHQFIAIKLLQKDGSQPWGQYYVFHIRQYIFSIDETKSPYFKWQMQPNPHSALKLFGLRTKPDAVTGEKYSFKNIHLVYNANVIGSKIVWREMLDLKTHPNTGTRSLVINSDGKLVVGDRNPDSPTTAVYFLEDEFGFRLADNFKKWMDDKNVKGLDCSRFPGILDTEWKGQVK